MREYLELARAPGIAALTATQLVARLPLGMVSLAVLMHVDARTGSYAVAGVVVACLSIGQAVAAPVTSRLAGLVGSVPTLAVTATVNAAVMVSLAVAAPKPALLCALGAAAGLSVPPLMPVVRALYPRLVRAGAVPALFAFDTAAQELIWIVGPLVATVLATTVATAAPLLMAAAVTAAGTLGFLAALGRRRPAAVRAQTTFGRVLGRRVVLVAMLASGALVASFTALEVALLNRFPGNGALAGAAIALSSFGSLLGGVAIGHRRFGTAGVVGMLSVVAAGTALTAVAPTVALIFLAVFAAGLGFAPAMSALYLAVSVEVPEHATTEAFGWLNTAALVGAAGGTSMAGAMSQSHGTAGAFATATVLAVAAALVPGGARLLGRTRTPAAR